MPRRPTSTSCSRARSPRNRRGTLAGPANAPVVSPDGQSILCRLRSTDGKPPLWRTAIVPVADTDLPRIVDVPRSGGPPDAHWFKNSRTIAYLDYVGGVAHVWLQDLGGGEPRKVTDFESGQILAYDVSRDGRSVVLSHGEQVNDIVLIRGFQAAASR